MPFDYFYVNPWSITKWKPPIESLFRIKPDTLFNKMPLGSLRFINLEISLINVPKFNYLKQPKSAQMI